jgi:DNA gyrase subunit A
MKFRSGDELLSMSVISANTEEDAQTRYVFTVTDGGWAKRTDVSEYRLQGRGGLGIKAMKLADARGSLVGAMVVTGGDEVMAIRASGQVTRSVAGDVPAKGRDTMGVKFVTVGASDSVVAIARNTEREVDELVEELVAASDGADPSVEMTQEGDIAGTMLDDQDNPAPESLPDQQEDESDE